ncbi:hypothetical protein ACIP98_21070 [Streptomyces sp. NPDC088354]|uniref:hypothetical protein n=1 Tax=Streptomyces sp. NPDC088354 TaxID=3365856 RepID=UPI0037F3D42C
MRRPAVFAVSGIILLTACSSENSPQKHETIKSGEINSAGTPWSEKSHLPIEEFLLSSEDAYKISNAKNMAIEDCMHAKGEESFKMPAAVKLPTLLERRYGLSNLAEAEKYGYAFPEGTPAPSPGPLTSRQKALLGDRGKPGGCYVIGSSKVTGRADKATATSPHADKIQSESWRKSFVDSRVQSKFEEWSQCMKSKGVPYKTTMDQPEKNVPMEIQKRIASDAVVCGLSTGILDEWLHVESEIQEKMIKGDISALAKERGEIQAQIKNADKVYKLHNIR